MATDSLVNSLWKPSRKPGSLDKDSLALISAYQHLQHPNLRESQEQMCQLCRHVHAVPLQCVCQSVTVLLKKNVRINYCVCVCGMFSGIPSEPKVTPLLSRS